MSVSAAPVAILGTGSFVPDRVVSNTEAGAHAGVDDAWIVRKTAIRERRWARPGQATSDLATGAARNALRSAGITADQLSTIVVATSTPDHKQPATAVFVHQNLGGATTGVAAFDVNAVCAGFSFALDVAHGMIAKSGGYGLVIGADLYSQILDPADRKTVILFGDGAGAAVIGPAGPERGIRRSVFHMYSDMSDLVVVPAGGSRQPYAPAVHEAGLQYFSMEGRTVRDFIVNTVPGLVKEFLHECEVLPADITHLVPHQANGRMLEELWSRLDLPGATLHRTVGEFGNVGAASVPLTLDQAARSGALRPGDRVLLLGMGGGFSVSLALIDW
ncbi:3-oxoacyl-[acyl-carrier-protein] synthase 3 [Streptomyces filipinensis]|uniref:3-oxoacyl-[acyl-carrier-protein] synthase 3 n=1 Tax=Streptomyces filipinensis TaxID=66887 RepID=A0A918IHR3_9ACTN|nr:ketoacyl-ACP synthase III [Streptomyces filipinensis]GGV19650.1 3-oxoacyl-[acyl-carrier-protein] synthase 3 [Streptomyces filipinensis]